MITKVTFTGADESIDHKDLYKISKEYPWVEWGILIRPATWHENNRFPGPDWIGELIPDADKMDLSLHLCGSFVNDILLGAPNFESWWIRPLWNYFKRVQINTHGKVHSYAPDAMVRFMNRFPDKEFIFQYDNVNKQPVNEAVNHNVNCSTLFDLSHGAGILPDHWPDPLDGIKCGYAGGLGPDNLEVEVERISHVSGKVPVWIDMESNVRDVNTDSFDLEMVRNCIDIMKPYFMP